MSKKSDSVVWIDRGWQPIAIGFVPSERAYKEVLKRYNIKADVPDQRMNGHCQWFENHTTGEAMILINLCVESHKRDPAEIISTLVHESVHAWQYLTRAIGEKEPGDEMMAYGIQHIYEGCLKAFTETSGKGVKWKT